MIKNACICLGFIFSLFVLGSFIGLLIPLCVPDCPKEKEKINVEEEAAYYKRVKKLIFTELKEKFGETKEGIPLISICPSHECCIMQPKNNEMVHHQF